MAITANPPAENVDPWYTARNTFDTQVKSTANGAETAAATAQSAADAANTNANGRYTKPGPGIPASDLAAAVQTSLGKADTAVQPAGLTKAAVGLGNVTNDAQVKLADVAGLNTVGWGRAVFIPLGGSVPGGTPTYTIVIEAGA